jgi:predicted ABC-type ATPase
MLPRDTRQMAPLSPETVSFRAGRLMLAEINLCVKRGDDFGFETTLSGRSYLGLMRRLKNRGHRIHFFFLTVPSVDLALTRVRGRVLKGGHDIPEPVVRRRFDRSFHNFFAYYRLSGDSWILFDNSGATPTIIAYEKDGKPRIMNQELYGDLIDRYARP